MFRNTLIAAAALVALAGPAAAQDGTLYHRDWTRVSFKDLDVNTPRGAKALMRRLQSAATQVCGPAFTAFGPGDENWRRACVEETVAVAVAKVDRPMLTALARPAAAPLQVATAETKAQRP